MKFVNGYVDGDVLAKSIQFSRASSRSAHASSTFESVANSLSSQMDSASIHLANLPPTVAIATDSRGLVVCAHGVTVVKVSGSALANGENLSFEGTSSDTVVLNITGERVSIVHSGVFLSGGIGANNILLNFVSATDATLASSGGPVLGIPSTILAPNAYLHFANAHVTGRIFAKFLIVDTAGDVSRMYAGGRVNSGCFQGSAVDVGCGSNLPPPPKPAPTH